MDVDAGQDAVWAALTDPARIAGWMMGAEVRTDWQVGSPITWSGEMDGTSYEDKGEVLEVDEPNRLSMTHYSPLMGEADAPENYHTVVYELSGGDGPTTVRADPGRERLGRAGRAVQHELAGHARGAQGRRSSRPEPVPDENRRFWWAPSHRRDGAHQLGQ